MKATIFRHNTNGLGNFAPTLKKAGVDYTILDTWRDDVPVGFDPLAPELLIVMGGSPDVHQASSYPFLQQELKVLEKRLAADLPTLGICLGAQLMAGALGGRSYRDDRGLEIGWCDIKVSEAGAKTPARHLDRSMTKIAQSHGATFDMPAGATLLASSELYPNQIFSWGKNALGIQCHPEADAETCAAWYVSYAGAAREGLDLHAWRAETARYLPTMMKQSELMLTEWLAMVRHA